jgi:hypothetical protein
MKKRSVSLTHGLLAGALGAACMTVLRMVAHRQGWIETMVPQAVEVWAKDKAGLRWPRKAASHHVADQLLHLGYGGTWGGIYALTAGRRGGANLRRALEFGVSIWALGSMVIFPALGIGRPAWRAKPREELVNIAAHAVYGSVAVYLLDEYERQKHTQPLDHQLAKHARIG